MIVKVIDNRPRRSDEKSLFDLIGKEFEVIQTDEDGVHIKYGFTDGYFIYHDEYEVVS